MDRPDAPTHSARPRHQGKVPPHLLQVLAQRLRRWQYRLLPGLCMLCKAHSHRHLDLCRACEQDLPWIRTGCQICQLPLERLGEQPVICGQCLTDPPVFDACRAPFAYREPVMGMIRRFKHYRGFREGWVLAELLAAHLQDSLRSGNHPDLIIPVPTHWRRRWQRGFNQTELLARQLSRRLDIPMRRDILRVTHHHPTQQGLGKSERRSNLHNTFTLKNSATLKGAVEGLHLALLDDVVTTGATADELARLLKRHGAMEVEVWSLARTPKSD